MHSVDAKSLLLDGKVRRKTKKPTSTCGAAGFSKLVQDQPRGKVSSRNPEKRSSREKNTKKWRNRQGSGVLLECDITQRKSRNEAVDTKVAPTGDADMATEAHGPLEKAKKSNKKQ